MLYSRVGFQPRRWERGRGGGHASQEEKPSAEEPSSSYEKTRTVPVVKVLHDTGLATGSALVTYVPLWIDTITIIIIFNTYVL